MKPKIIILMFSGLLAGSLAVSGQNNPPAADAATANTTTATNAAPPADATAATSQTTTTTDAQPAASASTIEASHAVATNSPIIPLIVMDEVPLTDAIKNLARQANINYMLDPRVSFGQPGPDGKPVPQPNVSIRWENITAEQALNALLGNYGLQLVDDSKTRISRVTIKDPAAPDPLMTKIIQLKYASPSNILASVQTALIDKRSKIMGDTRTSQLVVLATEKELDALDQMVERLDLQTKQVLIEAQIMETSKNPSTIKGVDWSGTLAAQNVSIGNNALPGIPASTVPILDPGGSGTVIGSSTTPGTIGGILGAPGLLGQYPGKFFNPATAFLNADGLHAVVSFLNQNSETHVLATPRAVTLDNEAATLAVTRASPIFKNTAGTQGSPGGSEVTYTNLGVILNVTPRISANNFVNLKVAPEVSRVFDTVTKTVSGTINQADEYDFRKIETHVMIPSGNTLVLGGLVSDDIKSGSTKVPLLGDIPFLGRLFRSDNKARQKSNLLIFITPTIVKDSDYQIDNTDFLKSSKAHASEPDWNWWDSGKPADADWSMLNKQHAEYK